MQLSHLNAKAKYALGQHVYFKSEYDDSAAEGWITRVEFSPPPARDTYEIREDGSKVFLFEFVSNPPSYGSENPVKYEILVTRAKEGGEIAEVYPPEIDSWIEEERILGATTLPPLAIPIKPRFDVGDVCYSNFVDEVVQVYGIGFQPSLSVSCECDRTCQVNPARFTYVTYFPHPRGYYDLNGLSQDRHLIPLQGVLSHAD